MQHEPAIQREPVIQWDCMHEQ